MKVEVPTILAINEWKNAFLPFEAGSPSQNEMVDDYIDLNAKATSERHDALPGTYDSFIKQYDSFIKQGHSCRFWLCCYLCQMTFVEWLMTGHPECSPLDITDRLRNRITDFTSQPPSESMIWTNHDLDLLVAALEEIQELRATK